MIYEFRTYCMVPGGLRGFEQRFGEALPARDKYSPLFAFWHSVTGRLHEATHVWPYEDLNARMERRQTAMEDPLWPPDTGEFIGGTMNSEIHLPAPFMDHGFANPDRKYKLFELCTDTYRTRMLRPAVAAFERGLDRRPADVPLVGCWYSEIGLTNRLLHVWAYESFEHRADVRGEAVDVGWPPAVGEGLLEQESKLLTSAHFSPI